MKLKIFNTVFLSTLSGNKNFISQEIVAAFKNTIF